METKQVVDTKIITRTLASGRVISLRESNGEDEGVLSNYGDSESGRNIPGYLARVIVDEKDGWRNPYTTADIMLWGINDKYHAMLISRIHSLGSEMRFKWEFDDDRDKFPTLVEDLSLYDWDFSKGAPPKEGEPGFFYERIKPYPMGMQEKIELMLSSKKQVRYTILNSIGEKKALDKDQASLNRNDMFLLRNLEWRNEQDMWQPIENFNIFSSREMAEMRRDVEKNDPTFTMRMELKSPLGKLSYIPIIKVSDFFFPGEI